MIMRLYMTRDTCDGELSDMIDIWAKHPIRAKNDTPGDVLWVSCSFGETVIAEAVTRITLEQALYYIGSAPDDDWQVISFPEAMLS